MPVNLAVGDILEGRTYCLVNDQLGIIVKHMKVTSIDSGTPTLAGVALTWGNYVATVLADCMSSAANFRGVGVRRLTPTKSLEALDATDATSGNRGPNLAPTQVCGIITIRTETPGPKARGRMYVPFIAQADITAAGKPAAALVTAMESLGDNYIGTSSQGTVGDTCTVEHGVYSKKFSTFYPGTVRVARDEFATQRRRGDYGATNASPV